MLSQKVPRWGELEPLDKSRKDHQRKHFPLFCIGLEELGNRVFWSQWGWRNDPRCFQHGLGQDYCRSTVFTELDLHFNVLFQALFRRGQAAAGDLRILGFVIMAI